MKILVKTTGAFIIPLGHGEFVLPEASEVEDCALLQSEIRNGRVEMVKVEASAEPVAEAEAEPIVEAQPARRNKRNR